MNSSTRSLSFCAEGASAPLQVAQAATPATAPVQKSAQPHVADSAPNQGSAPLQVAPQVLTVSSTLLKVPSLVGLPVRKIIELASAAGLEVEITGEGSAREQFPAASTMVASGTRIVVHCAR